MVKKLLYIVPFLVCLLGGFVVYDITHVSKEEYLELVANHPIQERLKLSKQERKDLRLPPNPYFDHEYLLEMDPSTGEIHPENIQKINTINTSIVSRTNDEARISGTPEEEGPEVIAAEIVWEERGPNNIGARTRVVFYDPNDVTGKRVFAGGVTGGLWKNDDITDANSSWSQVGIDENLSISCYAIDPNDSDIWYVGTGEAYTQNIGSGNGIWRSLDGGATWSSFVVIDSDTAINRKFHVTQLLAWDNNGTTELYGAFDGGIDTDNIGLGRTGWWSINSSGGISRISFLVSGSTNRYYVFSDIEVAADNSIWFGTKSSIYGEGGGKIFRSTDGENFDDIYTFTNGGRVELTVSKTDEDVIYAVGYISNTSTEFVKTTNGSDAVPTFTAIADPEDVDTGIDANDFARNQGAYNLTLEIDPANDAILYAGGIDLFRSTDSGASWSQISKWSNNNDLAALSVSSVHADQHVALVDPNDSDNVIFANDGGIYYSSDISTAGSSTTAIESRNLGYNISQFYSGAIGQDENNEMLLAGAQDTGSLFINPAASGVNPAVDIFGGDGVQEFIDKDGAYVITSYVYNQYSSFPLPLDTSTSAYEATEVEIVDRTTGSFINVADLDDNLDILYTNGTSSGTIRIGRFKDLTTTPTNTYYLNALLTEEPTAIKVSPYTLGSSTVFVGTAGGDVLKITDFDTTPVWSAIATGGSDINAGSISSIDFGENESQVFVTLHNYGVNNVYYTSDGGTTWEEKDGDFPNIPVKAIKMNPLNTNEVIIGTNAGVWKTENFMDASPSWAQEQNGMSSVKVTSFDMRTSDNTILAATYGRGLFTGTFGEPTVLNFDDVNEETLDGVVVFENTLISNQELTLSNINEAFTLSIYTMNGEVVAQQTVDPSKGSEQNISVPFQSGIYLVNITYKGTVFTKKIVLN